MTYEGVLAIDKPPGWTSHDVVAKLRRILSTRRIGHTGTLDPQVTGVLPVCIGRATRMVEYIQDMPKRYRVTLQFGMTTDTEDLTGRILVDQANLKVKEEDVQQVLKDFIGTIRQIPPMYSAVRVDGKRLYELARKGMQVERKAREVEIYEINDIRYQLDQTYPEVTFSVLCSKGTYIRTLCVDIGKKLQLPATMKSLMRTETGPFTIADCLSIEQVEQYTQENRIHQYILPTDRSVQHMPAVVLEEDQVMAALNGRKVSLPASFTIQKSVDVRVYTHKDLFIGIYTADRTDHILIPRKVFLPNDPLNV